MRAAKLFVVLAMFVPCLAQTATIDVAVGPGFAFTPASVTVAPGDTVRWNFLSTHTSTSDRQTGPEVWDSGVQSSGSFSHTFNTAGDYPYYCFLHSVPGGTFMNGIVHVAAAGPTLTAVSPATGPTAGGTAVTLTGTNFSSGCTADFGGVAGTGTAVPNATTITTTTPAHAAGAVSVTVTCSSGAASLPGAFTFAGAAPVDAIPVMPRATLLLLACVLAVSAVCTMQLRG